MDLTREDALKLHRQMWTDMQNVLGDCPDDEAREPYKEKWCREHGLQDVKHDCFLCEYSHKVGPGFCTHCPIKWPTKDGNCIDGTMKDGTLLQKDYYLTAPISEILALPEREDV